MLVTCNPFSALTLLVGWQEGHPAFKNWVPGAGVVVCLDQGADLHMAQLMPLPLIVSCFSKIQIGFTFLVPAHPGSPGKRAAKLVCVLLVGYTVNRCRTTALFLLWSSFYCPSWNLSGFWMKQHVQCCCLLSCINENQSGWHVNRWMYQAEFTYTMFVYFCHVNYECYFIDISGLCTVSRFAEIL